MSAERCREERTPKRGHVGAAAFSGTDTSGYRYGKSVACSPLIPFPFSLSVQNLRHLPVLTALQRRHGGVAFPVASPRRDAAFGILQLCVLVGRGNCVPVWKYAAVRPGPWAGGSSVRGRTERGQTDTACVHPLCRGMCVDFFLNYFITRFFSFFLQGFRAFHTCIIIIIITAIIIVIIMKRKGPYKSLPRRGGGGGGVAVRSHNPSQL